MSSRLVEVALPADGEAIPVRRAPNPVVFVIAPVIAAFGLLPALGSPDPGYRLVMLGLVGLFAVFVIGSVGLAHSASDGRVRVDGRAGSLTLRPPTGIWWLFAGVAAAMVGLAIPAILSGSFGWSLPRATPFALGLVGLGFLAQQLWWLRTPVGLSLTPDGLRGVRGAHPVELGWDDLAGVDVVDSRGARLVLRRTDGGVQPVGALWLGSDPNVVARVVEFFRAHPEQRAALAGEPAEAVRLAVSALGRAD